MVTILVAVIAVVVSFCAGAFVGPKQQVAGPTVTVTVPVTVPATPGTAGTGAQAQQSSPAQQTSAPGSSTTTDLSALKPVQLFEAGNYTTGPETIGTTSYPNSVRFLCMANPGIVAYNVAGAKFLNATIGVPNDATNAVNNTMTVTFFKGAVAATSQLGPAFTIALDKPQNAHVDLHGASQLVVCAATNNQTHTMVRMDVTLAGATLSAS